MAVDVEPIYVTVDQVKAYSTDPAITSMTDDEIKNAAVRAELYIDSIAGFQTRADPFQTRKFPRNIDYNADGTTYVPENVMLATIAQMEFQKQNLPDREHGIEDDDAPLTMNMSPRVRQLMKGLIKKTGRIELTEVTNLGVLL